MDGAAFDFLQVDAVAREGFESGEKRAGFVGEAQSERHFIGFGRSELRGLRRRHEQNETREIFRIVVNVFGENDAAVDGGGAAGGDSGKRFVAAGDDFADAAGGVFGGDAFQAGMGEEKFFALRERDGMRGDGAKIGERCAGASDELMFDVKNRFRNDAQIAFNEQIVHADDGAGERVFHRSEERVRRAFGNGGEGGIERGARNGRDGFAEKPNGGGFAEGAAFALEGNAKRRPAR